MHFIRNLQSQKIWHYVVGKNPTSVQITIMLAQKRDAELKIIEGLHNHDSGHEINNIYPSCNDKSNNSRTCNTCNGPQFIKDCKETMCLRCKPNFNNYTPSKCPKKYHSNKQLGHNTFNNNNNGNGHKINQHIEPNLQLSVSTNKPDQMTELLEATRKMKTYFKRTNITHHTLTTLAIIKVTQAHLTQGSINANLITTRMR